MTAAKDERSFGKILDDIEESANNLPEIDDDFGNVFALAEKKGEIDREALRAKIDATQHKLTEWEAEACGWDGQAAYYQKLADAAAKKAKALSNKAVNHGNYMALKMQARGIEELRGNVFALVLKKTPNPKTILTKSREIATASDAKRFPAFVTIQPREYYWAKDELKKPLKEIEKKKPEDLTEDEKEIQKIAHLKWSYKVEFAPAGAQ